MPDPQLDALTARRNWVWPTIAGVLVLVLVAGGALYGINYVDPVRILYKRMTADSPYDYDEIDPRFVETDPADLITVRSPPAAAHARAAERRHLGCCRRRAGSVREYRQCKPPERDV